MSCSMPLSSEGFSLIEDLSKNGVRVIRTRDFDKKGVLIGSVVEADCNCFGGNRPHSSIYCPRLIKPQSEP
jgi:hypothetical protein